MSPTAPPQLPRTTPPAREAAARPTDPVDAVRVPPQNLEAEASLLGAMLLEKDCIGPVLQIIARHEADRFYRNDHRLLFETLVDLYDQDKPIDLYVLEEELRRRGQLEAVGGRAYLLELVESVPSAANWEYYARIVRDKALLRELIRCAGEIMQAAYDQQEEATQILDGAEKRLFDVTEKRVSRQALPIRQVLEETIRQIELLKRGELSGVPTGFTELDQLLGGFQFGDFIVIAARPSMGKTALALSMLECIGIVDEIPAAFFSLEMSRMQIIQRMLCSHAQVDMGRLRRGMLSQQELTKLKLVSGNMSHYSIFIDDTPGMTVMELRAKARRLHQLHKIRVVFVDYLQLMSDRAGKESRQQEIAAISRGLKALARELNIPVVAMAQLNRQVEGREGNRPRMSDLRESGAIEQDADVVILLHRDEYYISRKRTADGKPTEAYEKVRGKAELIVAKQRNGPTGVVVLHFTPQFARFDNAAPPYMAADVSEPGAADPVDVGFGGQVDGDDEEAAPF